MTDNNKPEYEIFFNIESLGFLEGRTDFANLYRPKPFDVEQAITEYGYAKVPNKGDVFIASDLHLLSIRDKRVELYSKEWSAKVREKITSYTKHMATCCAEQADNIFIFNGDVFDHKHLMKYKSVDPEGFWRLISFIKREFNKSLANKVLLMGHHDVISKETDNFLCDIFHVISAHIYVNIVSRNIPCYDKVRLMISHTPQNINSRFFEIRDGNTWQDLGFIPFNIHGHDHSPNIHSCTNGDINPKNFAVKNIHGDSGNMGKWIKMDENFLMRYFPKDKSSTSLYSDQS